MFWIVIGFYIESYRTIVFPGICSRPLIGSSQYERFSNHFGVFERVFHLGQDSFLTLICTENLILKKSSFICGYCHEYCWYSINFAKSSNNLRVGVSLIITVPKWYKYWTHWMIAFFQEICFCVAIYPCQKPWHR